MVRKGVIGAVASLLLVAGCAAPDGGDAPNQPVEASASAATGETIEIADNEGVKSVPLDPGNVVPRDARAEELLRALGVEPLEGEAKPELVVVGAGDVEGSGAVVVDLSPGEGKPLDWEMVRQVQVLGEIFDEGEKAKELDGEFSDALERAQEAYRDKWTVALVRADGQEIEEVDPEDSELWGPVFTMVGMTAAGLDEKPDLIMVEETDPRGAKDDFVPARKLLGKEYADMDAVSDGRVYVAPYSTPSPASIVTYTLLLNELADQFAWTSS